ncbi:hypothetical protein OVW21_26555, partial [Klebsiella pneumoniae]|nr:hypothetical protein [Klebsiella pneumoniae]
SAGTSGTAQPTATAGADGGTGIPDPGSGRAGSGQQATCGAEVVRGGSGGGGGYQQTPSSPGMQGQRLGASVTAGGDAGTSRAVVSSDNSVCS